VLLRALWLTFISTICVLSAAQMLAQAPGDPRCNKGTDWCKVLNDKDPSDGTQLKMDTDIWIKQNTDIASPCLFADAKDTNLTNAFLLTTVVLTNKKGPKDLILCVRGDSKPTKEKVDQKVVDLIFDVVPNSNNFGCQKENKEQTPRNTARIGNMGCRLIKLAEKENKCIAFTSSSKPDGSNEVYEQDGIRDSVKGAGHTSPGILQKGKPAQIVAKIDRMNFDFLLLPNAVGMEEAGIKDYKTTTMDAGTKQDGFKCNRCFGMNILLMFDPKKSKWPAGVKYEHLSAPPGETKPKDGMIEVPVALYNTSTLSPNDSEAIPVRLSVTEDLTAQASCSYSISPSVGELFYITPGEHTLGILRVTCSSDPPQSMLAHFVITTTRFDTGELINEDIIEMTGSDSDGSRTSANPDGIGQAGPSLGMVRNH
jgi:hypothetical protein